MPSVPVGANLRQRVSGWFRREPKTVVPRQILVVDGNGTSRQSTAHLVESLGFQALQTSNLAQALGQLEAEDPEFVLLGFDLEDADGLEALKRIAEVAPEVPVIMLAASLWDPRVPEAMRHGAIAYMARPFDRDDLREVLGRR